VNKIPEGAMIVETEIEIPDDCAEDIVLHPSVRECLRTVGADDLLGCEGHTMRTACGACPFCTAARNARS
jgi:hypothetical protein